eukprot:jgi/Botrbrau1/2985/Bobra.0026s0047.1
MATECISPEQQWLEHKLAGDTSFRNSLYRKAIEEYTHAESSWVNDALLTKQEAEDRCKLYANRSLCYTKQGNWLEAIEDAKAAIRLNKAYVKGWFRLGSSLAALLLREEAVAAFEEALKLDPDNKEIVSARNKQLSQKENDMRQGKPGKQLETVQESVKEFLRKHGAGESFGTKRQIKDSPFGPESPGVEDDAAAPSQAPPGMGASRKAKSRRKRAAQRAAQDAITSGTASCSLPESPSSSSMRGISSLSISSLSSSSSAHLTSDGKQSDKSTEGGEPASIPSLRASPGVESAPPLEPGTTDGKSSPLEDAEAHKQRGNELYKLGQWQGAVEQYTAALELMPTNASYFGNRAAAYLMLRQYRQAADDCGRATEIDPRFARGFARGAKANMCMGNFGEAKEQYARALGLEPQNSVWQEEAKAAIFIERHISEGEEALRSGDPKEARWHADVAIRAATPASEPALLLRVRALQGDGKYAEALAECRLLTVRGDPTASELLFLRGQLQYQSGNMSMAESLYKEALLRDRDNPTYKMGWDRVRNLNRSKEAGNAAFKQQRWMEAHHQYTLALEADPELRTSFMAQCAANRSAACMRLGRAKEALEDAERAINCDDNYAKGYLRRGVAFMALKEWENAIRDFEKVQGMAPEIREVQQHLKESKMELKKSKRVDLYALLEIHSGANEYEIKKAYKKMALKYHPDKVASEEREEAEAKFKLLGGAHAVLSDPDKRQKYDAGWTLEEIEQGYPSDGGFGGGGVNMDDVLFHMFRRDNARSRGHPFEYHF